jgi:cationic peptide transport system ATP-binding protein
MLLLDIRNLSIDLRTDLGWVNVCKDLDLSINEGEICGLVGSSGSGKSIIAKAITGMYGSNMRVHADRFRFNDLDLTNLNWHERRKIIGHNIAIILQEAKSSLDPSLSIYNQMLEALPSSSFSGPWYKWFLWKRRTVNMLLHKVGIKDTYKVLKSYPHELSEVLCQKVIIAMAFGRKPKLLIADDPISSMTSISQLQILRLIDSFNQNTKSTVLYIANDLGPASNLMNRINMLYCGQIIESGSSEQIINHPRHPFTESLLNAIPDFNSRFKHKGKLKVLAGDSPEFTNIPIGCRLGPRCPYADKECNVMPNISKLKNGYYRCHFPLNMEDENV